MSNPRDYRPTLVPSLLSLSNPPFCSLASRNCDGNAPVTCNYKATISLTQQIKTITRWRPAVREWQNKIWQWKHTTQATNKLTMTISITCKNSPMRGHELAAIQWIVCTKTTCLQNKIVLQGSHVVKQLLMGTCTVCHCLLHVISAVKHWDNRNFLPRLSVQKNVVMKLP